MATRFYLPSTGAAAVSPTFGASWTDSAAAADRIALVNARISSAFTEKDVGSHTATEIAYVLCRQYVSAPLAAQTITGTVKGVVRARETHNGANCDLAIRVAKCANDGSSVTEILAIASENDAASNAAGAAPEFSDIALTNRRFEQGVDDFDLDLASTGVSAGDRLIVEIGYGKQTTNTTRRGIIEFGDNAGSDLAEDETSTSQLCPWVEFSMDIAFQAVGRTTKNTRPNPLGSTLGVMRGISQP